MLQPSNLMYLVGADDAALDKRLRDELRIAPPADFLPPPGQGVLNDRFFGGSRIESPVEAEPLLTATGHDACPELKPPERRNVSPPNKETSPRLGTKGVTSHAVGPF